MCKSNNQTYRTDVSSSFFVFNKGTSKLYFFTLLIISISSFLQAQNRQVSGTVKDAISSDPLPGATVFVKGTTNGTVTDIDGNFNINASPSDTIVVTFVGFTNQEFTPGNQTLFNILLKEDLKQLDEIVVIGYGTVRKSDLTGSVSSVKNEELIKSPASDPVNSMQGKVAGLQILSGGEPGTESYVRLRGINTLNNNKVLYVVDGVIINDDNNVNKGISFLNSQDIESIEVLKDASAKAIFGTRGANGVIIVTTKKSKGEATFNFSADYGVEKMSHKIELMNGKEFAQFINAAEPGTYNNIDALPNVDWQELVYEEWTPIQNYTLSASGSTDKLNYYISGGYYSQKGILPKSDFDRFTLKFNNTYQVKEYLKIGTSLTGFATTKQNPPGVINTVYWAWPINEPYNSDGTFAEVLGSANPLAAIEYTNSNKNEFRAIGNVYAEIKFLKDFKFKSSYQFDVSNSKSKSFTPVFYVAPLQLNEESDISVTFNETRKWIFENTLNYNKEFGEHRLDAIIGYTAQEDVWEFISGSRVNVLGESPDLWYLHSGSSDETQNDNYASLSALTSILFRANYAFADRYIATLTFRRDGSSKFGINNRYANFPAIALGWNISNEAFFPKDLIIDKLKVRASWGVNGNEKINYLDQYSYLSTGYDAVFGTNQSLNSGVTYSGQPGNPDLKWETTTEYDLGIEFGLFKSKLTGELDYYDRLTSDILVKLTLPGFAGAGVGVKKTFNAADVRNSGFEFVLNWQDEIGNITYGLGLNGNINNNQVEGLGEGIPGAGDNIPDGYLGNGKNVTITEVGQPIGYFYGYKVIGVFQNADQLSSTPHLSTQSVGDFIYQDTNNDGTLDANDRTYIGSWIPKFVYGFNANIGFKGLSLNLDFAGQSGNDIYNGKQTLQHSTLNHEVKFINRWTGEGTSNTDPRASIGGANYEPSDYFIEDASFLKLRTVTLSYALPNSIVEKIKMQSLSVFVRGTDLWIMTNYSGYTAEIGSGDSALGGVIDLGVYPTTKVISGGLNLRF
ncbi:MAG: TonB-dependent receptor [Cyclobacteriaceae bacterium]|nr:TonB-dependent receptor [Cyclobacteriaceae bacterium]